MTFVSYAQTYEDVMLARAFAGLREGFYIDVGAQDPRFDSVTKAFYDLGWHGINLEPVEHWYRKLVADRPRDINLCLAAGDHEGTIEFHETDESGLSTASAEFAARHRAEGQALRTRQVPVSTLDAICREHDVQVVHFLKVDVEGAEAEVLRGLDLSRLRPWIILVEATEPNSRVSTHAQWEHLVTAHDYRMVYQDGLNRFYLAREHEELAAAFDAPPNIFDDFVRREQVDLGAMLQARIDELVGRVQAAEQRAAARDAEVAGLSSRLARSTESLAAMANELADARAELHGMLEGYQAELDAHAADLEQLARTQADFQLVVTSRSWRITAPLRRLMAWLGRLRARGDHAAPPTAEEQVAQAAAAQAIAAEEPYPLTRDALAILARFPVQGREARAGDPD